VSAIKAAVKEADNPRHEGQGYFLVVTMRSGAVHRGAYSAINYAGVCVLLITKEGEHGRLTQHEVFIDEKAVESVTIEW
jgi:hypothetical protein